MTDFPSRPHRAPLTAMNCHDDSEHLRQRARTLRLLATQLECTAAMELDRFAGPDTWRTPRAELCCTLLRTNQIQLARAVAELRHQAERFDERARVLDAIGTAAGTGS